MAEGKRCGRREEELVEAALAAAAAALFVSGVKKLMLPAVFLARWPAPSPVLFLLLNVVIASIVVVSVQPRRAAATVEGAVAGQEARCGGEGARKVRRRKSRRRECGAEEPAVAEADRCVALVVNDVAGTLPAAAAEHEQEEEAGSVAAAEEVDRRAEEFISAFRHHLRVDSFSSGSRRGSAGIASCS